MSEQTHAREERFLIATLIPGVLALAGAVALAIMNAFDTVQPEGDATLVYKALFYGAVALSVIATIALAFFSLVVRRIVDFVLALIVLFALLAYHSALRDSAPIVVFNPTISALPAVLGVLFFNIAIHLRLWEKRSRERRSRARQ